MSKDEEPTLNIIPPTPSEEQELPPPPPVAHLPMARNSAKNTDAWETESVLIAIVVPLVMVASGLMLWLTVSDLMERGFNLDTVAWLALVIFCLPILLGPFVIGRLNVFRRLLITALEIGIVFAIYPLIVALFFTLPHPDYIVMGAKIVIYVTAIGFLEAKAIRRHYVKQNK